MAGLCHSKWKYFLEEEENVIILFTLGAQLSRPIEFTRRERVGGTQLPLEGSRVLGVKKDFTV